MHEMQPVMASLIDILLVGASNGPERKAVTFLENGVTPHGHTWASLDQRARAIGAYLQQKTEPGDRALLFFSNSLEYVETFWGCMYAGIIAIPLYPPNTNKKASRIRPVVEDSRARIALTTSAIRDRVAGDETQPAYLKDLSWTAVDEIPDTLAQSWERMDVDPESVAYLQYTSGSSGNPKGVMVTHRNLLENFEIITWGHGGSPESVFISWLPIFHDMGLIYGVLFPASIGAEAVIMEPAAFVRNPHLYLKAFSDHRGTHSAAPNFAFELCNGKVRLEDYQNLDLSSIEVIMNAAEPLHAETMIRFAEKFGEIGFDLQNFRPGYGLAEGTLLLNTPAIGSQMKFLRVSKKGIEENQAVECGPEEKSITYVGHAGTYHKADVRIVNPHTKANCKEGEIGEIWAKGATIAKGYWQNEEATVETFRAYTSDTNEGPFLRTKDLGFILNGELCISGRLSDLIIVRGRNHHPQDLEHVATRSHAMIRPGCAAAFSLDIDGTEALVMVCEVRKGPEDGLDPKDVAGAIRREILEFAEIATHGVVIIAPGTLPKTSSGKIRRRACKKQFLENEFDEKARWISPVLEHHLSATEPDSRADNSLNRESENDFAPDSSQKADRLIQWLRDYAATRINSRSIDERRTIPPYIVLDFGNVGLLGMQIPVKYGGLGMSNQDTFRVLSQLGAIDHTLALFVYLHITLGTRPLLFHGTEQLKDELLPQLASGRILGAYALTEPGAGSHPRNIGTTATPDEDGSYLLSGTKIWSGTASWAGVVYTFAQTQDANGKPTGISGFVLKQGSKGMRQGPEALTMGMRGMIQNTVYLDQVKVEVGDMLGQAGKGMEVAAEAMMFTRLAIAAACSGGIKRCLQLMHRYAERRHISTGRLVDNPVAREKISSNLAAVAALDALLEKSALVLDQGKKLPADLYAAAKVAGPELMWNAADDLMQMLGGRGYIENNFAPQIMRDARVLRIFEGPTETICMYLGSRMMNNSGELKDFFANEMRAKGIWDVLEKTCQELQKAAIAATGHFSNEVNAKRWAWNRIGEMTTYAVLEVLSADAFSVTGEARFQQGSNWSRERFEVLKRDASAYLQAENMLNSAGQVQSQINSFENEIGDIEQTLPFPEQQVDAYLKKNQDEAEKSRETQVEPWFEQPITEVTETKYETINPKLKSEIREEISLWIADQLKIPLSAIDAYKSFSEYGFDSVMGIEIQMFLEHKYGLDLDSALIWNYPTVVELVSYLYHELLPSVEETAPEVEAPKAAHPVAEAAVEEEDINDLSDEELLGLLKKELDEQ